MAHSAAEPKSVFPKAVRLNLDILILVMSHLEWTSDLLSMMRTCREVRAVGMPIFLKEVYIVDDEDFIQFCDFIFDDISRFRLLKSLTLHMNFRSVRLIDCLVSVLQHAQQLEVLALIYCDVLERDERASKAVSSLKHLKSAHFRHPLNSPDLVPTLLAMESKLSKLVVWFNPDQSMVDPVSAFANFASSLEEIFVCQACFCRHDVVYPQLKVVSVRSCGEVHVASMARSFPMLKKLQLEFGPDVLDRPVEIERNRERNRSVRVDASWKALDLLQGDVDSLYALGLICQVHTLEVTGLCIQTGGDQRDINRLTAIVADTKPVFLKVSVSARDPNMESIATMLKQDKEHLTHLNITFDDRIYSKTDPTQLMSALLKAIKTLKLRYMACTLAWQDHHTHMPPNQSPPPPPHPMRARLNAFYSKLESFVQQAATEIPSLRYLVLHFAHFTSSYWEIQPVEGGEADTRRVQKLSSDKGPRIMEAVERQVVPATS